MHSPSDRVTLVIDAGPESDLYELERLTQQLLEELLAVPQDIDTVQVPRAASAVEHAKAGDILVWGTLLASLTATNGALGTVIGVVQSWLARSEGNSVTMEIGDEKLVLTGVSSDQVQKFISEWFARHSLPER